ncbi:MAG: (2Fe-2S)-binding protein [Nitrososphaerales archaeon]
MTKEIRINVNGRKHRIKCQENWTLLHLIRDVVDLKGTKEVCGIGECGACTVLKDGKPVSSCCELAIRANGAKIITIEGVAAGSDLHPLQKSFIQNSAFQCGFCTSGMIVMAKALLESHPNPKEVTDAEIRDYMSGNLCRCTGYLQIVDAIRDASKASSVSKPMIAPILEC